MNILKVEHHSAEELISRLRRVTLMKNPGVRIYENASISLERIATPQLSPAQRYVLSSELLKVRELKWSLADAGYDIFNLEGYLSILIEGQDEAIDLLPVVVEESIERDGSIHNIINDGMHRAYMAYLDWVIPQVVFVRNVPKQYPYYAFPVPEGWAGLQLVDSLPENLLKKWHRIRDYKSLYRDFNSAFQNVGGPRGRTK
ncbi:MAG TPA: hypothetical protein PL033_03835 [Candidatus Brocadiia bacterium]|nr:hypothetical protein [Candidatus Brocadiia bacterium]